MNCSITGLVILQRCVMSGEVLGVLPTQCVGRCALGCWPWMPGEDAAFPPAPACACSMLPLAACESDSH